VGIVFQDFALFDELTPRDNLAFAWDHSKNRTGDRAGTVEKLASEFGVNLDRILSRQSGGQKQRVAVARTLAFNPDVILYDEPTSGLDPANSRRVAERIRKTARDFAKASVVVTHDYTSLAGASDRILWLDPREKTLSELSREELDRVASAAIPKESPRRPGSFRLASLFLGFLSASAALPEAALDFLRFLPPLFPRLRWGLRYLRHYLMIVASPSAFLYIGTSGAIAGFVATYFTFEYFPYRSYTEPLLLDDVLGSLGFLLYRILVPVLATVLIAARSGGAVAADVGNRRWSGSIEAMRSFGLDPRRYLYTGAIWAFLLGVPVMTFLAFLSSELASLLAFAHHHPGRSPLFWDLHFHKYLAPGGAGFPYEGSWWLLAKLLACAAVVALTALRLGASKKESGVSVNRGITLTVIWATMGVLVVHLLFAFFEFKRLE